MIVDIGKLLGNHPLIQSLFLIITIFESCTIPRADGCVHCITIQIEINNILTVFFMYIEDLE